MSEAAENEATKIEEPSPTPVAKPIKGKRHAKKLLAAVLAVGLLTIFLSNHHEEKPNKPNTELTQEEILTLPTPQLPKADFPKKLPSPDELKQQMEDEKLQKIRMLAPGIMFAADESKRGPSTASNNGNILGDNNSNAQFMSRVGDHQAPVVMASHIQHPGFTLAQGTLIWATLETEIASDLPGMVRAVTSQNIYSEDGTEVLLPRGSRLIGQYTSSIAAGQERVFVVWQRAIRPDHIDIQLNSPGTDPLGTAGMGADMIDHHFWSQFGNALLLSMIGASTATVGVNNAQDPFNSAAAYREALSNSFSESASNSLESNGSIKPTIYVNQGKKISVFVAQDLDFFNELKAR